MTRHLTQRQLVTKQEVVQAPNQRACTDQNFGLPTRIYAAMAGLILAAIAVLASAFSSTMIVSYGIIVAFLAAFFAIPAIFVGAAPSMSARALSWQQFRDFGIDTATGRTGAGEATVLALILPVMILFWAIAVTIIATLVR